MIPASLMSHLFHFVNSGKHRPSAPTHTHTHTPPRPPHSLYKRIDYTPTAFLLLLVSGRAMCYLTKNNNEGDGKCNLIPLIHLPLSPPLTGKQEAIRVQRREGEERDVCFMVPGSHRDSSAPRLSSPPLINGIVFLLAIICHYWQTIEVWTSSAIQLQT